MYATYLKNRIYKNGTIYCCFFCNVKLIDAENVVAHTINDLDHLQQIETASFFRNMKIDEDLCIKFVDNGIVIINSREFKCTICSCSIPNIDHVSEHINGKKHTTKLKKILDCTMDNTILNETNYQDNKILSIVPNNVETFKTEACSNNDQNKAESNSIQFNKNNTTKEKLQNYSCNRVCKEKEDFFSTNYSKEVQSQEIPLHNQIPVITSDLVYCSSCHIYLKPNSALRYHRMFHLSQKNCNMYDIVSFCIGKNNKSVYCLLCDCIMKDENDLENHLIEIRHQKRLIMFYYLNDNTFTHLMYRHCSNATVPQNANNIYNILEFNKHLQYMNYHWYQSSSSPVVQGSHMNYKLNQQSIMNSNVPIIHDQNMQVSVNYSAFPLYFCFVCHIEFVDENLLYYHYTYDYYHKYRMEAISIVLKDKNIKFAIFSDDEFIICTKCQVKMIDANEAVSHIFQFQHMIENEIEHQTVVYNNETTLQNTNVYACPICKINLTHDCLMIQHLESECHQKNIQEYYINVNSASFEKIIFSCSQCNMNFFNDNKLLEHLRITHRKRSDITADTSKNKFCHCNNDKCVATNETHQRIKSALSHDVDHTLNNSVNLNLNEGNNLQNVQVGANRKNNNFEKNKNTHSSTTIHSKNLINFSERYVKLCVESGEENIFKINPERVKLLELGIYLTFPYKSGRGCISCGCEVSGDPQLLYEHLRTEKHEKNVLEMQENNEYFENYNDQFSDLELAKQYMYEDSDEWVKCFACDSNLPNCDEALKTHINSGFHISNCQPWIHSANEIFQIFSNMFKNLWYYIDKFFCNICCTHFVFEVGYARHLESSQHLKEVENRILRQQNLQFDFCIICSYFWYARSDQYKIHCNKDSHKYILKSRNFTVPNMPDSAKTILTSVEKTIDDLILESNEIALSDGNVEAQLLESVEEVVKSKYPTAKAYLFGSRISSLGIKDSDLDIYLDCENQYKKLSSINQCQEQLLIVQECFHKYQDIWVIEEIVLRTRVPIIKIRHRPTNLNCDISFINGLSVEKSKILSYFTDACLPCRKMILYLKIWNNLCRLWGKKGITTFAISWLVIFYLQLRGFLPSIWDLIKLENQSNIIAGWETGISKIISVKEIDLSTKDLLKGFFSYYANFDYISSVASPYLGQVMMKSQFSHIDDLPDEMDIYKQKIKEEKVDYFRLDSPMCIQEPIDLSQNLTKAVTKLHLRMFKQYCSESAAILQNSPSD